MISFLSNKKLLTNYQLIYIFFNAFYYLKNDERKLKKIIKISFYYN